MNICQQVYTGVAVLRPWPYGPPLRGRAPHHNAGMATAPINAPASALVGGLGLLLNSALPTMKTIYTNNKMVSNGNQDVTVD